LQAASTAAASAAAAEKVIGEIYVSNSPDESFPQLNPLPVSALDSEPVDQNFMKPDGNSIIISDMPELSAREEFLQHTAQVLAILPEMLELAKEIRKDMAKRANGNRSVAEMSTRGQLYQFGMERVSDPGPHLMVALEMMETYAARIKGTLEAS
jgi:hypothetical protein